MTRDVDPTTEIGYPFSSPLPTTATMLSFLQGRMFTNLLAAVSYQAELSRLFSQCGDYLSEYMTIQGVTYVDIQSLLNDLMDIRVVYICIIVL